ncbi:hypothetical protein [Actinomadura sp. 7K534]|uniref:hypothetical protein n=1 Tax=Actinomadura sp. 7K534 TaxID=2530366 RepID=UPI0010539CF8|nr:hypothetical protein [Actinomadura sp. 7K534]TDB90369.1 hypothetical protein E1266_28330 [Actinomadura sp. 7K534]
MHEYFYFEVGQYERHLVEYFYDRFWGKVRITVDRHEVVKGSLLFSFAMTKRFEFTVGHQERHHVIIDKTRKVLFAGFRPSVYNVYVDGRHAFTHEAV